MLRPAVLLDAAMTVAEARVRLAQHGYWTSLDDPSARAVLQAYVDRIAAAVARQASPRAASVAVPLRKTGTPAPEGALPPTGDTRQSVTDIFGAAAVLGRPLTDGRIVIRRTEGTRIFWYLRTVTEVFETLSWSNDASNVRDALGLHEFQSLGTVQADTIAHMPPATVNFNAVVLRGIEFVAVAEQDASATPSGTAPNTAKPGGTRSSATPPGPTRAGAEPPNDTAASVQAYPRVQAPEYAHVGQPFDVKIGLGAAPMAGQPASGIITLPAAPDASTIDVDVQVVADGFQAPGGWRRLLTVTIADPYAAGVTVQLIADPQAVDTRPTTITVHYAVGGVTRGSLVRRMAVLAPGVLTPEATSGELTGHTIPASNPDGTDWLAEQPAAPALTVTASTTVPDIEINLAKVDGNTAGGLFHCTMRNAHGFPVPDAPLPVNLGNDPRTFAKLILDEMPRYDGMPLLDFAVQGHGATIAEKLPAEFWTLLRAVAAKVGDAHTVTLQFNSADAYVPWELALVDPPIYPDRVPLLAAQTSMGRWILGENTVASPPRATLQVRSFALMAGMYKSAQTGMKRLPKAEEEVKEIAATYASSRSTLCYDCDANALSALLGGSIGGGAQVVHFAGHGQVDPTRPGEAAIYLSNGIAISPVLFRKSALGSLHSPFLFLNACMVGTAGEMLGDFGGFPGNCLAGNFTGLVAPLWAVNDEIAKWMALEFYREAMSSPAKPVADILRDLRSTFASRPQSSSYLAYVYYGNPHLTLV